MNTASQGFDDFFVTDRDGVVTPRSGKRQSATKLDQKSDVFLGRLVTMGYSASTVKSYSWMGKKILRANISGDDKIAYYNALLSQYISMRQEQSIVRRWMLFDFYDILPDANQPKARRFKGTYNSLNPNFKNLVDLFRAKSLEGGRRNSTTSSEASSLCSFLFFAEKLGIYSVDGINDILVQKYKASTDITNGIITRLGTMFKLCGMDNISTAFPQKLPIVKHVYKCLSEDERSKLEIALGDSNNDLSHLHRAVGYIAMYTGMRSADIRNLKFSEVDWVNERIVLNQLKTGTRIILPLIPRLGNTLYNYIKYERPSSSSEYIFLSQKKKVGTHAQISVYQVLEDVFNAAGISQNSRRGAHIIRHSLATSLISQNVDIGVVADTLGHTNTNSTMNYINVTPQMLKICALSISDYPLMAKLYKI